MRITVRRVAGVCGLIVVMGCAGQRQVASSTKASERKVYMVRTVVEQPDGTQREIGEVPWSEATAKLVAHVPVRTVVLNERGYPIGFEPAWTLAPGVEEPPADVAVEKLFIDREGRLVGWKTAE